MKISFVPPVIAPSDDTVRANVKELFTVQERTAMSDLISRGHIEQVGAALDVDNPERAYWLNKYLDMKRPKLEPELSVVREEMRKYEAAGNGIDSPEKAKFWEERLKLERDGQPLPPLEDAMKALDEHVKEKSDVVDEDDGLTKKEIMKFLDDKGVKYSPTMKKDELKALLEAVPNEK